MKDGVRVSHSGRHLVFVGTPDENADIIRRLARLWQSTMYVHHWNLKYPADSKVPHTLVSMEREPEWELAYTIEPEDD